MNSNHLFDPNNKKDEQLSERETENFGDDGVYPYNADGSPMDTSERTYISTELPEEDEDANNRE